MQTRVMGVSPAHSVHSFTSPSFLSLVQCISASRFPFQHSDSSVATNGPHIHFFLFMDEIGVCVCVWGGVDVM